MKKNSRGILIFLSILLFSSFIFLIANGDEKKTKKYYQIIDYFKKDKVYGYELKLNSGALSLIVEEENRQTKKEFYDLPNKDLMFKNPGLAIEVSKALIKDLYKYPIDEIGIDLKTGKLILNKIVKPGVYRIINYKLPNVDLFLIDTRDYIKSYNERHPNQSIKINYERDGLFLNTFMSILANLILPVVVLIIAWFFVDKYVYKGSLHATKSKAIKYLDKGPKVTFEDVAALKEEKEELRDIAEFLKNSNKFEEIGARVPSGVLMVGPPGTGKTLLAKALAGEADVPFFFISGSAFVEMFVGLGASRVRELFEQAKKNAPCIMFIDEIDAVGGKRYAGASGGNDERNQTLNQLLVEMDGFSKNSGVVVIAATNMADSLDKALLRPGRFDRQIYVGYPDIKGREEILKVHTRDKAVAPDVNLEMVAKATIGFTGADLAMLMNEAALIAIKNGKKSIRSKDIDAATVKVIIGTEKNSKIVTERNKISTAYHESGHALCAYYCEHYDDVNMVSIIPTGAAGGFTLSMPKEDDMYTTDNEMFESIVVSMGGRVAEKLMLNETSTGASSDMKSATLEARKMVTVYGFNEELGNMVYDNSVLGISGYLDPLAHSEEVRSKIDLQIKKIIDKAYAKAVEILTKHKDKLEILTKYLLDHEKIDALGFEKIMKA